jgi:hypothetical protein
MTRKADLGAESLALFKQVGVVGRLVGRRLLQARFWKRVYVLMHPLSFAQKEMAHVLVSEMEPDLAGDNLATYFWYAWHLRSPAARRIRQRWPVDSDQSQRAA